MIKDVLNEPLFLNGLITSQEKPLLYTDWIAAGITRVKDICYEAVPGFLPPETLHEILTDSKPHALSRAIREYRDLLAAIPKQWLHLINANHPRQLPTLQPCFAINTSSPGSTPPDLVACKTRTFYHHLHQLQKPTIPAIDKWKEILQPAPDFSTKQWKTLYSPLISNKQGDINWKVAHRVLPTALSLNRMNVYNSSVCHRCGVTDTIKHALIDCPVIDAFWTKVQPLIDKIANNNLPLTVGVKVLGKVPKTSDLFSKKHTDLINWILTIRRCTIHKSAVYHRVRNQTVPPEAIFGSIVKSHLREQFKLYVQRGTQFYFPFDWCLGEALAKVENNQLVFTI